MLAERRIECPEWNVQQGARPARHPSSKASVQQSVQQGVQQGAQPDEHSRSKDVRLFDSGDFSFF